MFFCQLNHILVWRIRENFRSRSEYISQLISDIASYYGYNEFLAEKLFQLFSVNEVHIFFCGENKAILIEVYLGYRIL